MQILLNSGTLLLKTSNCDKSYAKIEFQNIFNISSILKKENLYMHYLKILYQKYSFGNKQPFDIVTRT